MGLIKSIADNFSGYPVFTMRDVELALPGSGKSGIRSILSYMVSKGKLYRVRSGRYSFSKDSLVSGFAFRPFYYGLLSALTYREMWDQLAKPSILTTNNVRSAWTEVFGGTRVETHHIPRKYLVGFSDVSYGGITIPVSDPEKTLIDFVYLRQRASEECYAALSAASNAEKLESYLKAYDSHTKVAVRNIFARYSTTLEAKY